MQLRDRKRNCLVVAWKLSDTEISEYRIHQTMNKVDDDLGNYAVLAEELLPSKICGRGKWGPLPALTAKSTSLVREISN